MKKINGTFVPDEMHMLAQATCNRGGKVFLSIPETGITGGCRNCNAAGEIVLQVVTGGPDVKPSGGPCINEGGQWYSIKSTVYACPKCQR